MAAVFTLLPRDPLVHLPGHVRDVQLLVRQLSEHRVVGPFLPLAMLVEILVVAAVLTKLQRAKQLELSRVWQQRIISTAAATGAATARTALELLTHLLYCFDQFLQRANDLRF